MALLANVKFLATCIATDREIVFRGLIDEVKIAILVSNILDKPRTNARVVWEL